MSQVMFDLQTLQSAIEVAEGVERIERSKTYIERANGAAEVAKQLRALIQFIETLRGVGAPRQQEGSMQKFSVVVSYLINPATQEWRSVPPVLVEANTEEDASRTASAIADSYVASSDDVLVRLVGDNGRVIGEYHRPPSP
jgi:hypothetical protein